jgi:ABC-2 type transport system permease protein
MLDDQVRPARHGEQTAARWRGVAELWRHRDALRLLVRRDLTVRYQQSVLGYLWTMLDPLATAVTYWFVFGVLYGDKRPADGEPYVLFLVSGLFAWIWVSGVLAEATTALTVQRKLITTISMPRELFPIGRVMAKFLEYVASLPVVVLVALIYRAPFGHNLLLLPVAVGLQMVLLVGVALLLSSLNVMLRDTERLVRLLQRVLLYGLPVVYPLTKVLDASALPAWVKTAYQLNPLVGIFELYHAVWLRSGHVPPAHLILTAAVGSLGFLAAGMLVFTRLEPAVLKEL